jgi:hypothetical protein
MKRARRGTQEDLDAATLLEASHIEVAMVFSLDGSYTMSDDDMTNRAALSCIAFKNPNYQNLRVVEIPKTGGNFRLIVMSVPKVEAEAALTCKFESVVDWAAFPGAVCKVTAGGELEGGTVPPPSEMWGRSYREVAGFYDKQMGMDKGTWKMRYTLMEFGVSICVFTPDNVKSLPHIKEANIQWEVPDPRRMRLEILSRNHNCIDLDQQSVRETIASFIVWSVANNTMPMATDLTHTLDGAEEAMLPLSGCPDAALPVMETGHLPTTAPRDSPTREY